MLGIRSMGTAGGIASLLVVAAVAVAQSKSTKSEAARSPAQRVLDQSAEEGKFTFLVFYKSDNSAFHIMHKTVRDGVAARGDKANVTTVLVTDPAEKAVVDKFDLSRSPMPLTLALAPNLAITGIFPREIKDEHIDAAFATPTMTRCMKSLQANKLVFVCLQTGEKPVTVPVIKALQQDPDFEDRVVVESLPVGDPEEARFLKQMQVEPGQLRAPVAALIAPPGVLIGKYDAKATKDEVTTALHKAGKCCDDPNCKHNHGATTQKPATTGRK